MLKKNPDAKLLSGGTDLSLEVTKSRKEIKKIIYLNSIKELDFIKNKKNEIEVGASVSLIKFEIPCYDPDNIPDELKKIKPIKPGSRNIT